MDKLVEREDATRNPLTAAPALAVQFFLIPLAVVAVAVMVYVGFRSLITDDRSAQDYLTEIRTGGSTRRWPAAYELSRLMADPKVRADRTLAPALVKAFEESKDDQQVRRYLALALGRLDPPLPEAAVASLTQALDDPDSETRISVIWALGSSGDPAVVARLQALYVSPATDAVALARHGSRQGAGVIRQMLDRQYVEQIVKRDVRQDGDQDPIADVMISGLRAAGALRDETLRASVTSLSQRDRSMRVRQAALDALKAMG
jgi:hypothetical protein